MKDLVLSQSRFPHTSLDRKSSQCPCRQFSFDHWDDYGDHIQTCQCQSVALPEHEWIVYRLSLLLRSVGHRVKTHGITLDAGNERVDIEIKDYVILPRGEDDRFPPRTLVMDVTIWRITRNLISFVSCKLHSWLLLKTL